MSLIVAVPAQTEASETRVALVPDVVGRFTALGCTVLVESGAGNRAHLPDSLYDQAQLVSRKQLLAESQLFLCVQPPDLKTLKKLSEGSCVAGFLAPYSGDDRIALMRDRRLTSLSVELIPRISRAQSMDVLSSQASIAGYRAVLNAAQLSGRFFPMLTTAAGTIRPAKVLVIGAGVAGLQALATARRLGAMTEGYDVRPETREQIQSLGARFLDLSVTATGDGGYARELSAEELKAQQDRLAEHLETVNVVITTAAIPGRPSPRILTREMVERMQPGSVIIDLAAEGGGNCELTRLGETIVHQSVTIDGPVNLPATLPIDASQMFARNLYSFLSESIIDGEFAPNFEDEIIDASAITHDGKIRLEAIRQRVEAN